MLIGNFFSCKCPKNTLSHAMAQMFSLKYSGLLEPRKQHSFCDFPEPVITSISSPSDSDDDDTSDDDDYVHYNTGVYYFRSNDDNDLVFYVPFNIIQVIAR